MIKETRVDRWESKTNLSIKLSAEEVLALIPKHFTNAERVEVLTPFAKFWDRQHSELYSRLHHQLIREIETRGCRDREFQRSFLIEVIYEPYFRMRWNSTAIMEMIYERDYWLYRSDKYTWKEIKENLNSFSELINKLSK